VCELRGVGAARWGETEAAAASPPAGGGVPAAAAAAPAEEGAKAGGDFDAGSAEQGEAGVEF
jgi:hypothetical protein